MLDKVQNNLYVLARIQEFGTQQEQDHALYLMTVIISQEQPLDKEGKFHVLALMMGFGTHLVAVHACIFLIVVQFKGQFQVKLPKLLVIVYKEDFGAQSVMDYVLLITVVQYLVRLILKDHNYLAVVKQT